KIRAGLQAVCGRRIKVGHGGTLDPLATGLLVIGTGKCTKQLQHFADADKTYVATLRLGESTPSYDAETEVDTERPWAHIDEERLRAVLPRFTGEIQQRPPDFSAKRFQGERAYHLARAGEPVELPPVTLTIHRLALINFDAPHATLEVHCSKGTYIGSSAIAVGLAVGCGAHLAARRRTASGDLHVRDARTPEQWSKWLDEWAARQGK